jgi:outer membrane protein assembly factor BamB
LLGVEHIVMVNETSVTGHDIQTGVVLWTVPWPGQSNGSANVSQPVPIGESRLLISKGYSHGSQVVQFAKDSNDRWTFEVIWRDVGALKTKFTSPVIHGDYAYGLSDGILECIRLSDGFRQWKQGRYRQGQLLLVNDVLLITSESGAVVLVAADPAKFKELAKLDVIGDVTWNTPALSGDRLLIRNSDEAACLRLPLAQAQQ